MAVTENNYVGDGSTVLFSLTFPYLEQTDVKVLLDGVDTTAFSFASDTQIQMDTAPANGVAVRIYRATNIDDLEVIFSPGSSIRAQDLNDSFDLNIYAAQEVQNYSVQDIGNVTLNANYTFTNSPTVPTPVNPGDPVTKAYADNLAIQDGNVVPGDKGDVNVSGDLLTWTVESVGGVTPLLPADIGVTVEARDATILKDADIGVTVQPYDADTAKLDALQIFTQPQIFTGAYTSYGGVLILEENARYVQDVGFPFGNPSMTFDLSKSNVFGLVTINGALTWTFANPGASGYCTTFSIFANYVSGSITYPGSVIWKGGTAPTLAVGKCIFTFTTIDGGTTWFGLLNQEFS